MKTQLTETGKKPGINLAPAKILITIPNVGSSKADEIAFLEKLYQNIGPGAYIDSLFTREMIDHVIYQIKGDFGCDLYGMWKEAEERLAKSANKVVSIMVKLEEVEKAVQHRENMLTALTEQAERERLNLEEKYNSLLARHNIVHQNLAEANIKLQALIDENEDLQAEVGSFEWENIHLKAKIYDFEHGPIHSTAQVIS